MNEKLEYIENEMKKINEEIKVKCSNFVDTLYEYIELLNKAEENEDEAMVLGLRLRILEIYNDEYNDGFNKENFNYYSKILDSYINLELYQEAYDFSWEVYGKEFALSDGYVYDELIHVFKYIPCLCYKLGLDEEYEETSMELFRLIKHLANEELDGDIGYFGHAYFSGAKIYVLLKEYEKAIEVYRKAEEYFNKAVAEYKAAGALTPEMDKVLNRVHIELCDAMIEVNALVNNRIKVEKYNNLKMSLMKNNN